MSEMTIYQQRIGHQWKSPVKDGAGNVL